jgi:probable F420-dependent oxidoreductase
MYFDASIFIDDFHAVPDLARRLEDLGFDALWVPEAAHNPYQALVLSAYVTQKLKLGTAISVAFARSPTVTAYEAWDLARFSNGRFMLGLGTQIKAHIVRRFSMVWDKPGPRMREYILCLRALWDTFQNDTPLEFRGEFYKLTYMNPFFKPAPIENPHIPIFLAAVGPYMTELVGELCDGMHVHAFTTRRYLQEVTYPHLEKGLAKSGRDRSQVSLNGAAFIITNEQEKLEAKKQIAFYASTPAYRGVLDLHGWGELQDELTKMTQAGQWNRLHEAITDEILAEFAVTAGPDEIGAAVRERFEGLLDRVAFYMPYIPNGQDEFWKQAVAAFK